MIVKANNRILPLLYDASGMTVGTASSNELGGKFKYYEYRSGDGYTEVSSSTGRYYYQPALTAPGMAKILVNGTYAWANKPVQTLFSCHCTPYATHRPAMSVDSSGNIAVANCAYANSEFLPYIYRDDPQNPPVHDLWFTGTNVDETIYTGDWSRIGLGRTGYGGKDCQLRASAWMLAIVEGTMSLSGIRYSVSSLNQGGPYDCTQDATSTRMLDSGTAAWVLIKTNSVVLAQDSNGDTFHRHPIYVDQPRFKIALTRNSAMSVTSFGWDVWPYDFA